MIDPSLRERIARVVQQFEPGATLLLCWSLEGGMSARIIAFEIETREGRRRRLIARTPDAEKERDSLRMAEEEFRVLSLISSEGLPVPTPLALEAQEENGSPPFFVLEYIEGRPELAPGDPTDYVRRFADALLQIHRCDLARLRFANLPRQDQGYEQRTRPLVHSLHEGEILELLQSVPPITRSNPPVLRHGDFWPGNVLWRDGEIVGVIDWEEALVGEPLADVAICRLDLWWILGEEAMMEFTEWFRSRSGFDFFDLPYWDLCAALRPVGNIEEWAPAFTHLGRPDVTVDTLRAVHREFVQGAVERFKAWRSNRPSD